MARKSKTARKVSRNKARTAVKGKTRAKPMKFDAKSKITVTAKGRSEEVGRRKGSDPWKRFQALRTSRTVGAFLAKPGMKKWMSTIARAVRDDLVRVS